jgi:hypothetical protein
LRVPPAAMLEAILERWLEDERIRAHLTAASVACDVLGEAEFTERPVSKENIKEIVGEDSA